MKGVAKKTFSSGRDEKGQLIIFEKGQVYDLSKFSKEKQSKIARNFEEKKEVKKKLEAKKESK